MSASEIAGLLSEAQAALRERATARVVGERVRVLSVEDAGERRGLVARVERKGVTHVISLADLEVEPASPLHAVAAAYRAMLGIERPVSEPAPAWPPAGLSMGAKVDARGAKPASVEVNMQDLMLALEDHTPGHAWYFDRETGDLHPFSEDLPDDGPVTQDELEDDARFVLVEPEASGRGYRDMEEFAETVREPALRQRLGDALAGKGAFGRFKRVLADYPAERDRWFRLKEERLEGRAREWLKGIGLKPDLVPDER